MISAAARRPGFSEFARLRRGSRDRRWLDAPSRIDAGIEAGSAALPGNQTARPPAVCADRLGCARDHARQTRDSGGSKTEGKRAAGWGDGRVTIRAGRGREREGRHERVLEGTISRANLRARTQ